MRAPRYKPKRRYGFNMTPMIDVVFLLIIFFLVSSHLARQENLLELPLPVAESGADDIDQQTPRVTINIKDDGSAWLGGRVTTPERLQQQLAEFRSEHGDTVEVRIRTSRDAPYASVEPVMLACTSAGIWNVTFAVYREDLR